MNQFPPQKNFLIIFHNKLKIYFQKMENNPHKKFREIDSFDFLVNCEKNEQKKNQKS